MGLRDKLLILSQGAEGATAEDLVSEWKHAVDSLFAELKLYVSEYTSENLLSLIAEPLTLSEERLGAYQTSRLIIRSGNAEVRATPYGRIVAGAVGRVDLSSAALPNYGYMLLRVRPDTNDWQISHRQPNPLLFSGGGPFDFGPIVHAEPLTKTAFEQALDSLF